MDLRPRVFRFVADGSRGRGRCFSRRRDEMMGMRRLCDDSDRCVSLLFDGDDDDHYYGDGDDNVVVLMMMRQERFVDGNA